MKSIQTDDEQTAVSDYNGQNVTKTVITDNKDNSEVKTLEYNYFDETNSLMGKLQKITESKNGSAIAVTEVIRNESESGNTSEEITKFTKGGLTQVSSATVIQNSNSMGYSVRQTDNLGNETVSRYGVDQGEIRLLSISAPNGNYTYEYDEDENLSRITGGGAEQEIEYGNEGWSLAEAGGNRYAAHYNEYGLLQSIQADDVTAITYGYNQNGDLSTVSYANENLLTLGYDGRLLREITYGFNNGNSQENIEYTHNEYGEVTNIEQTREGSVVLAHHFDEDTDTQSSYSVTGANGYNAEYCYEYDEETGLLSEEHHDFGENGSYAAAYTYDAENQVTDMLSYGVNTNITYDALGRISAVTIKKGDETISEYDYEYMTGEVSGYNSATGYLT